MGVAAGAWWVFGRDTTGHHGDDPKPVIDDLWPEKYDGKDSISGTVKLLPHLNQGNAKGTVTLREIKDDGFVTIEYNLEGLKPSTKHGFHVHEFGVDKLRDDNDCSKTGGH